MRRPTVLLFDIDGTLVTTGGAGRKAIERAFQEAYGRADACSHFSFSGMTDRAIMRGGLEGLGVEVTESVVDRLIATYVTCLADEVKRMPEQHYRVHPGMKEAVLAGRAAGFAVGLGTGNVREGARLKLERVQLWNLFDFGGFGDDHELRPELIRAGANRGRTHLKHETPRVVVIGDTPKDVSAAQAIGAESIAVATGGHPAEELRATGATWVFETLASEGALRAVIEGQ